MADRINSASRVLEILRKVRAKQDNERNLAVWSSIFRIEGKDSDRISFDIANCLKGLHDEIEIIRAYMMTTIFDKILYNNHLDIIKSMFSVHGIQQECKNIKIYISDERILCLGYCTYILPNEELLVESEDLTELNSLLSSLESSLIDSILPDYTKNIIKNNIEKIRTALRMYEIIGAKAFNAVTDSSIGEVVRNQSVFVDTNDPETVTNFGKLLQKMFCITGKAMKADGAITAGINFAHYGAKALEFFDKIL
ncbi:hypothetical protein VU07_03265 [Desulfobulbus sp. F4]|nr:hypothetical protein [Desulfobulbus sp. F3]MCW5200817.1 hypothetical protein [Desulfobulbus sp. F4]